MKLTIKTIVLGIALVFSVSPFVGCDPTTEVNAKYDAMTGEKLPEKVYHLKDSKVEYIRVKDDNDRIEVMLLRFEIEGHIYYSRADCSSSLTHSAACLCNTNNVERN